MDMAVPAARPPATAMTVLLGNVAASSAASPAAVSVPSSRRAVAAVTVPKAVQVEHRSVVNVIADFDEAAPVPAGVRGTWWTSPSFDVSMWEIWAPLTRGGTVLGLHEAGFYGPEEHLTIVHCAESRAVFAHGALRAARWIIGRPAGLYGMEDMLETVI